MQIFVAFSISDESQVIQKLEEHYSSNYFVTRRNSIFIATSGETTRQIATKIGLGDDPAVSSGIVVPVNNYWGRFDSQLWEWLSVKLEV